MKYIQYVRPYTILLAVALVFCGCVNHSSTPETGMPTETTLSAVEGVPTEIVEAFCLVHQRLEEGTLRMRIYDRGMLLPATNIPLDDLLDEDLSGSKWNVAVTAVENHELQEYRERIYALQPQLLVRIPELENGAGRYEDICLAYIFETEDDGVILKLGMNIGTTDIYFSDEFCDAYSLAVNDCFYFFDAAFYDAVRPFLSEEQQEFWDIDFHN